MRDLAVAGETLHARWTPADCHAVHMLLGLVGEVLELDQAVQAHAADNDDITAIIEELGDIEFYLAGLYQGYAVLEEFQGPDMAIMAAAELVLTEVKRNIFYRKDNLPAVVAALHTFSRTLDELYHDVGYNRDEILQANITKLRTRYGKQYSDEAANARRDKDTA